MATLALAALQATPAAAQGGYGYGFGPVIGYSEHRSWSIGWEASRSVTAPVFKFSVGGSYHIAGDPRDPVAAHYVAFEPWLIVGGTIGVAVVDGPHVALAYGVWEGGPIPLDGDLVGGDNSDDAEPEIWMLTLSFGWRGFGGTSQVYFTPKLWRFATIELHS